MESDFSLRFPDALQAMLASNVTHYSVGHREPRQSQNIQVVNDMTTPAPVRPGVYSCGHTGSEIFMNFINPSFPETDDAAGSCVFKIGLANPNVCQVCMRST